MEKICEIAPQITELPYTTHNDLRYFIRLYAYHKIPWKHVLKYTLIMTKVKAISLSLLLIPK